MAVCSAAVFHGSGLSRKADSWYAINRQGCLGKKRLPRVSIIVPIFNAERWLPEALLSVAGQDFEDWDCSWSTMVPRTAARLGPWRGLSMKLELAVAAGDSRVLVGARGTGERPKSAGARWVPSRAIDSPICLINPFIAMV